MNISQKLLVLSIILFIFCPTNAHADPCSSGKAECIGGAIFDCSGGDLNLVNRCDGKCENAQCIAVVTVPNIYVEERPVQEPVSSNDFIFYFTVILAAIICLALYIRIRTQK